MSCMHQETTTVRWLYGEGPDDHLHHIADCVECQDTVARFERLEAAMRPVRPALSMPRRRFRFTGVTATLLAATALIGVWRFSVAESSKTSPVEPSVVDLADEDLDDDLDDIDGDLDWVVAELDLL